MAPSKQKRKKKSTVELSIKTNLVTNAKSFKKSIFISHASKDKFISDAFIDKILENGLGVSIHDIFCTSADGAKIISGSDWRQSIRQHLIDSKIAILLITPNYKESEVCLNEMGAAWVLKENVLSLIVEPIDFNSVGIIQQPKQAEKLLDGSSLDKIKDIIQKELNLYAPSDRWSAKKLAFIEFIKDYLITNPFKSAYIQSTPTLLPGSFLPLKREEFYSKLISLIAGAEDHIYLMYMRDKPPHSGSPNEIRDKYVELLREITKNQKVRIDRIILNTEENLVWVQDIMKWYKKNRYFSLYILDRLIPPLGIKIIDKKHLFLFYAGGTQGQPEPKYMYLQSEDMCRMYVKIFEETKAMATVLMLNGNIISKNVEVLKLISHKK